MSFAEWLERRGTPTSGKPLDRRALRKVRDEAEAQPAEDAPRPPPNLDFADLVADLVRGDPLGLGTLAVAAETTRTPPPTPTRAVLPRTEALAPTAVVVSPRSADRRGHDEDGAFTLRTDAVDLNGNGEVDFADILILLGAWGPC